MAEIPVTGQKINGNVFDHSSIEVKAGTLIISAIQEISYEATLEPGKLRGTSAAVLGRTRGEGDAEGSMKLAKQDFQALINKLAPDDSVGYMEVQFDITVQYVEANSTSIKDDLFKVRITNMTNSSSQGTDPAMVELDLHILDLVMGGKRAYTV